MLTRKDTDGNELHTIMHYQSVYELTSKQYTSTRQKILYSTVQVYNHTLQV